jgi:hypothetical protein
MRPSVVAQALAFLLMVLAVNSALNAVHGLQVACRQSTGEACACSGLAKPPSCIQRRRQ